MKRTATPSPDAAHPQHSAFSAPQRTFFQLAALFLSRRSFNAEAEALSQSSVKKSLWPIMQKTLKFNFI
jgi:hypothetical protein